MRNLNFVPPRSIGVKKNLLQHMMWALDRNSGFESLLKSREGRRLFMEFLKKEFSRENMTQLLLLGKFEYGGVPIFKMVLEC